MALWGWEGRKKGGLSSGLRMFINQKFLQCNVDRLLRRLLINHRTPGRRRKKKTLDVAL